VNRERYARLSDDDGEHGEVNKRDEDTKGRTAPDGQQDGYDSRMEIAAALLHDEE